ncbi:uncharacterized protein LOC121379888 [Gigantopelta aegis]|uniref:uncharacterized protein LOC121379888 n=1 Tax=Gigantopelta aegis TaxID=1735272 RepID=UPI001B88A601|nr:uncharacterized protein LOC121379888 [Gigantopelta aegis]
MELRLGCFVQVCAILLRISPVLATRPVHFLQRGMVLQDMERKHGQQRIFAKTSFIPDVSDDEDLMAAGSGLNPVDTESDLQTGPISCCMLGKLAGKTGSLCRMTSDTIDDRAGRRSLGIPQRPTWHGTRQLSLLSASVDACAPGKELEFYKCCFAAKRERFEYSQWVRSRHVKVGRRLRHRPITHDQK